MSTKKNRHKRKLYIFLYIAAGLILVWIALGFFLLSQKQPASIYVFPENPKQGDTVFIRVKTDAGQITGNLGQDRLVFYKKGNFGEWISFLGIDADQKPGDYKIYVDTSSAEHLSNKIKVDLADFSTAPAAFAPNVTQNGITQAKAVSNIITNDNPALKKVLSNFTPQAYFSSPFSYPLSKMEKTGFSFGKFISFAKYKLQHLGTDLKASENTDIFAVNDGKVVATLNLSNYGKTVIIDHGLDIFSMYLHLDEFKVNDGQIVKRGQLIGLSGDTGYVTAPHLHFSMRVGSSRVDPIVFIKTTQKLNDNFFIADITNAFLSFINSFK
jgi:murein DD-endopeptidase MepM/ murein hydrolase activator NlpD